MTSDAAAARPTSSTLRGLEDELLRAHLLVAGELEASLQGSRRALVALDLAGIEGGSREQVGLIRKFEALMLRSRATVASRRMAGTITPEVQAEPELQAELRRCHREIMDALRLQAALLSRARCKLRILANMLAGPSAAYSDPYPARHAGLLRAGQARGEI